MAVALKSQGFNRGPSTTKDLGPWDTVIELGLKTTGSAGYKTIVSWTAARHPFW
jgi:hypothetical protein